MEYNFQTYVPKGSKRLRHNYVCLTKNHIVLAENLADKVRSNEVELKYDIDNKTICINFDGTGLKVKDSKINASGFYKFFDIKAKGNFEGKLEDGCLIIELG